MMYQKCICSETILECICSETILECICSETILECICSETILECICSESILECICSETILECISGLQITIQKLSDIMSDTNRILSDIYENLSDVKFSKNFQAQYNG